MALSDPATWSAHLSTASLNGITMRWADTAQTDEDRARPAVLLMHGWPESWYSWRHQLKALHAAGFRGIAPDMRGYGGTSAPKDFAAYNVYTLAGDMLSLLQHLGLRRVALVGHDHGAALGWRLALLHPDIFVCYMAMSVPYEGHTKRPLLEFLREKHGDPFKKEDDPNFHYMLHHNLPWAASDYAQNTSAALRALYIGPSDDALPPLVTSPKLYVDGKTEPMWRRQKQPRRLQSWITEEEMGYYIAEYERYGWEGGMNWYRVFDLNWAATKQLEGRKVQQPVAFIAGSKDLVVGLYGGIERMKALIHSGCEKPVEILKVFDGDGHWIQQERADEVNGCLLEFLQKHRSLFVGAYKPLSRL